MAKNAVLKRKAKRGNAPSRKLSRRSGKTEHLYRKPTTRPKRGRKNAASSSKAEVVRADGKRAKDNPRFVITNLKQTPQWIYEKGLLPTRRDREPDQGCAGETGEE